MKKYLVIASIVVMFACAWGIQYAQSTVVITAPDGFAVGCASGFTRMLPHLCMISSGPRLQGTGIISDFACRTSTFSTVPTTAKAAIIELTHGVNTANAILLRGSTFQIFRDVSCVDVVVDSNFSVREEVATASTQLHTTEVQVIVQMINQAITYKTAPTGSGSTAITAGMYLIGYYD